MSQSNTLEIFVQSLEKIGDPRSKQGVSHQFQTILAIVFLGLLANISNCTAQVIAADSFALERGVREPCSDRKMPIHVGDFFVPRSIPTIQDKSVWRGGEVVRRATDHTSEPSLMDFFFERKVSFVKKNAANNASTM